MQNCSDTASAMVFLGQAILVFLAFVFLFGVVIQIVDPGGGASGALARSRMTVGTRVGLGTFSLVVASLCIVGVISLSRESRKPPRDWDGPPSDFSARRIKSRGRRKPPRDWDA